MSEEIEKKEESLVETDKKENGTLFDLNEVTDWRKEWQDMPEYNTKNIESYRRIIVHFRTEADIKKFSDLIQQRINIKTDSLWFPELKVIHSSDKRYVDESTEGKDGK